MVIQLSMGERGGGGGRIGLNSFIERRRFLPFPIDNDNHQKSMKTSSQSSHCHWTNLVYLSVDRSLTIEEIERRAIMRTWSDGWWEKTSAINFLHFPEQEDLFYSTQNRSLFYFNDGHYHSIDRNNSSCCFWRAFSIGNHLAIEKKKLTHVILLTNIHLIESIDLHSQ